MAPAVGHRQVRHAVAVEVAHRHGVRIAARRDGLCCPERPVTVAEQDRDAAEPGRHCQVDYAVAVKIADGDGGRRRGARILAFTGRLERSIAVAEEDRDIVRLVGVGHGQVEHTIAVEVAHGEGGRVAAGSDALRCLERSIAVAKKDRDTTRFERARSRVRAHARGRVGDGEIRLAVAIEVAHDDEYREVSYREGRGRAEGPVAVAEEDRDVARLEGPAVDRLGVGHGQVEHAVPVEVAHGEGR